MVIFFLKSGRSHWIEPVEWWSIFGLYLWYGMYIYLGSWHICSWAIIHNDWNLFWTVCNGRIFKYPMAKMEKVQLIIILIWNFIFLGLRPKGQKKVKLLFSWAKKFHETLKKSSGSPINMPIIKEIILIECWMPFSVGKFVPFSEF